MKLMLINHETQFFPTPSSTKYISMSLVNIIIISNINDLISHLIIVELIYKKRH